MLRKQTEYDALSSPSVVRLGLKDPQLSAAMQSPSLQVTSEARTKLDMPLSLVIGQEAIKTALILLAVNSNIGGLAITGSRGEFVLKRAFDMSARTKVSVTSAFSSAATLLRTDNTCHMLCSTCTGTAKSVMARALHRVMPPIEIVKGSQYNIAPDASPGQIDAFLLKQLRKEGRNLSDLPTEIVTCPFVQVGFPSFCRLLHCCFRLRLLEEVRCLFSNVPLSSYE
jgi:hypothetical protein